MKKNSYGRILKWESKKTASKYCTEVLLLLTNFLKTSINYTYF